MPANCCSLRPKISKPLARRGFNWPWRYAPKALFENWEAAASNDCGAKAPSIASKVSIARELGIVCLFNLLFVYFQGGKRLEQRKDVFAPMFRYEDRFLYGDIRCG